MAVAVVLTASDATQAVVRFKIDAGQVGEQRYSGVVQ